MTETVNRSRFRNHAWAAYCAAGLAALAAFFFVPQGFETFVYAGLNLTCVGALTVGIRLNRPEHLRGWYVLLLGQSLYFVANLMWDPAGPFPALADAFFIPSYLTLCLGIWLLARDHHRGSLGASGLEALIVTCGIGVLSWVFLIAPHAYLDVAARVKAVAIAYPLIDLLLVGLALTLFFLAGRRSLSHRLVVLAAFSQLLSDSHYAYAAADGSFEYGSPWFVGWLLSWVALGAAALHPSMARFFESLPDEDPVPSRRRLVPLALAALAGPLMVVVAEARGEHETIGLAAVISALLFALVFVRMGGLVNEVGRRVADREAAEVARRESDVMSRSIIDSAVDAFISLDERGRVTRWNPSAERIFGWSSQDAVGRRFRELLGKDAHEQLISASAASTFPEQVEARARRKDDIVIPVELSAFAISRGGTRTFHAFVRDVSERKRVEEITRAAKEEAEKANQLKSEFLSRMSHELRTPLNAILGFTQLLELEDLAPEQRADIAEISKAGQHLLNLINDVLEIARLDAGRTTLSREPVEVREVLEEAIEEVAGAAAEQGVRIDIAPAADEHEGWVQADRQKLKWIMVELLSNAINYSGWEAAVTVGYEASGDAMVAIDVTDQGPGIRAGLDRLFMPFERLGAEDTGVTGTGLGLAKAQRYAMAMGGHIEVATEPGSGSTFSLRLPKAADPLGRPLLASEDGSAPSADATVTARIVYIEDNPSNVRVMERVVAERSWIELVVARNGEEGLARVEQGSVGLVLLDLDLPDIPGDEVLRRLREQPDAAGIPVVVMTADATTGRATNLLERGATALVTKPFDLAELLKLIDRTLSPQPHRETEVIA